MRTKLPNSYPKLMAAAFLLGALAFSNISSAALMVPVYIDLSGRLGLSPNININTDPTNPNTPEAVFTTDDSGAVEVWVDFFPYHIENPPPHDFQYTAAIMLDLPNGLPVGEYVIQDFISDGMGTVVPLHNPTLFASTLDNRFPNISFTEKELGPFPFPIHSYHFRLESDVLPADVAGLFVKSTGFGRVGVWVPEPASCLVWAGLIGLAIASRRRRK